LTEAGQPGARGPLWAGLAALVAGLPALGLPFLSDDWSHAIAARDGTFLVTPFSYFRPLASIDYWIDWQLWGWTAAGYRAHGLILAAVAAALVVVLVRRYTGDAALATTTGIVFALHPYHIGAVAWIAARSDLLSAVLVLVAAWCFDRWCGRPRGVPWLTLLFYELALLAKEGAVVLPAFLLVVALWDRRRRLAGRAWLRGFAPLAAMALAHFLALRPVALGASGLGPLKWLGAWRGNLMAYGSASVLPLPPEIFEVRVWLVGGSAALATLVLLIAARAREGRIPVVVWPAAMAFTVLLGPSLIGFVQRYYFLPSAAAALALAALLRAAPRRVGIPAAACLAFVWFGTAAALWTAWYDGGAASRAYVAGLVEASREPGVETIVVVGAPHRIHGIPVTAALEDIVPLRGGNEVRVVTAGEFDYPTRNDAALAGTSAIGTTIRVELGVEPRPYSRYVWPGLKLSQGFADGVSVSEAGAHGVVVEVTVREGRRVLVWSGGGLKPL